MSEDSTPFPPATAVLVSGGSRGLGLALVRDVVDRGAKVATFARTVTPELTHLADEYPAEVFVDAVDVIGQRFDPAGQFVVGRESGCRGDDRATGEAVEQFQLGVVTGARERRPGHDQVTAIASRIKRTPHADQSMRGQERQTVVPTG